jgi:hypothetical protein
MSRHDRQLCFQRDHRGRPDNRRCLAVPQQHLGKADLLEGSGPELRQGARFRFTTFSFPGGGNVTEYERPANRKAADSQPSRHRLPILL